MSEFPALKNTLLLDVLNGKTVERTPVWMMRQAGRYLPDYMKLRAQHPSFFHRVETPELVTEITVMPVEQVGVDAAIIFSDILVIPQALGFKVTINPGEGPRILNKVEHPRHVEQIVVENIAEKLDYVMKGLTMTRNELNGKVPLIGFAGAPWTIFCYLIQGQGSKDFGLAKAFCFQYPAAAKMLLQKITDATIEYLKAQVKAGAQVLQLFDSWAGLLSPQDFNTWAMPFNKQIIDSITEVPSILFAKGAWYALEDMDNNTSANGIGIDWTVLPETARAKIKNKVIQGNFDPSWLLAPTEVIEQKVKMMLKSFGKDKLIANLGHGITPNVPVDAAKAFVDTVKNYQW